MDLHISGVYNDENISQLFEILSPGNDATEIVLDIASLGFIEVGPLALILGFVRCWSNNEKSIRFRLRDDERKYTYLQRIDFFSSCGLSLKESFNRQSPNNRFVPFKLIDNVSGSLADDLGTEIADCITPNESSKDFEFTDQAPEDGYYEAVAYSVTELVKNVQQHSKGCGYIVAQYYPSSGLTKIAIIDNGIGIARSFKEANSPHYSKISNDLDALKLAVSPEVSSKTHFSDPYSKGHENAGVGLTLLSKLALSSCGSFTLLSGKAMLNDENGLNFERGFDGTFACFSFSREKLEHFQALLESVKTEMFGDISVDDNQDLDDIFGV